MRGALLVEIVRMALDTIRAQALRSALTVLGALIGIALLVGMTEKRRYGAEGSPLHRRFRA